MPRDICIVHIEDEFHSMKYLPAKMRQYIEQYLDESSNGEEYPTVELKQIADGGDEEAEWVVYELTWPGQGNHRVRYIFSAAKEIPEAVKKYICGSPYFIVDVLRPRTDGRGLWSTAQESVASALACGGTLRTTTIYTACQGSDLHAIREKYPDIEVISKVNVTKLNLLLGRIVIDGLSDA